MHIHKPQKIDLEQIYPCPCPRKRGKLKPILLTDAFGCDRCSLLFELEKEGYSLRQVGGIDSQHYAWQWIGKWQPIREYRQYSVLEITVISTVCLLSLVLLVSWLLNLKSVLSIPIAILLFALLGLIVWRSLVLRRRDL